MKELCERCFYADTCEDEGTPEAYSCDLFSIFDEYPDEYIDELIEESRYEYRGAWFDYLDAFYEE